MKPSKKSGEVADLTNAPFVLTFGGREYKIVSPPYGFQLQWAERLAEFQDRVAALRESGEAVGLKGNLALLREMSGLVFDYMQAGEKLREEIMGLPKLSQKDIARALDECAQDVFR